MSKCNVGLSHVPLHSYPFLLQAVPLH
jgi:hypothetical protein